MLTESAKRTFNATAGTLLLKPLFSLSIVWPHNSVTEIVQNYQKHFLASIPAFWAITRWFLLRLCTWASGRGKEKRVGKERKGRIWVGIFTNSWGKLGSMIITNYCTRVKVGNVSCANLFEETLILAGYKIGVSPLGLLHGWALQLQHQRAAVM